VDRDEGRLVEVEAEIAMTPELPEDIVGDLEPVEVPEADIGNAVRLRNAWIAAKQFEAGWKKAREKADGEAEALKEARGALEEERAALTERSDQLGEREAEIARAERALEEQRSAAKAGFASDLRVMTYEAAQRRDEILAELARLEDDARVRASTIVASAQQKLEAERAGLAEERAELRGRELTLRKREAQVQDDLAFAQVKESMLAGRFERRLEAEIADVREELEKTQAILELERQRREARNQELRVLRAEVARYGEDPETAKRRSDDLVQQLTALRDELSRRPPADEVSELRQQAKAAAEAQDEAAHWRQRHDTVERQLRYQLVSVGELEVLRDERDVLQAQRETLRQAIAQQRTDWEELQAKKGSEEPFPACSAYDRDERLKRPANTRRFVSLAALVEEVRHRMATDSATAFYYSESDVRLFMAGLASSRLHLLQGISGTGKTSLPREFFKALGGEQGPGKVVLVCLAR
jgi:chromosome segregation ATPase